MKLLIDPVAPFSYMLKKFESSTLLPFDAYKFSNSFGTFEGKWKSDFFYLTADKIFLLRIQFLMVEQTTSVLDVDGVIGLGYSEKIDDDCSVFEQLHKMTDVFKIDNLMSYDKKKKLLTIGELPKSDNYNPVKFPLFEGDSKYPAAFVNLTKIRFINGKDRRDWNINQTAILGIMPVIIAPKQIADDLRKNYLPNMTTVNTTKYEFFTDKEKFFTDIYYKDENKETKTEMVFDRIAYKYTHTEPYENEFRSTIRLGDDGKNALEYWYIGIDLLNVQRADFNYINGTVTLYSPTAYDIYKNKYYILLMFVAFALTFCFIIGCVARNCCQKKKMSEIKKGEELIEL